MDYNLLLRPTKQKVYKEMFKDAIDTYFVN